jgi:hypothetical protein
MQYMVPVNARVLHDPRLVPPWVIAPPLLAQHWWGYPPCPATDPVCSLAILEGSDYLDGRYVSPLDLPSCAIPR